MGRRGVEQFTPHNIPSGIEIKQSRRRKPSSNRSRGCLILADDHVSVLLTVKRRREQEVTLPKGVKRFRENKSNRLPVHIQDLTERTLVETAESWEKEHSGVRGSN